MNFNKHSLEIDPVLVTDQIIEFLRFSVLRKLHKYGGVVGISGGIDSSVVLALCVKAFGLKRIAAIMMPEKESDPESERMARSLASYYKIEPVLEDITLALEGFNCYTRRDEAIKCVFPEYDPALGYQAKIGLPQNLLEEDTLNVFYLTILTPEGEQKKQRLTPRNYFQIVAASNFKQRTRMSILYYHAELRNFAVIGTANKNEHDQGFFVKYGDGGVDVKPIAHLYKTQIYQLADYLEIPEEIRSRKPTTDTYSAHSTQQEFFFRLPFDLMDPLWFAQENEIPLDELTSSIGLSDEQIQRAFNDFTRKSRTTEYLRTPPIGVTDLQAEESIQ